MAQAKTQAKRRIAKKTMPQRPQWRRPVGVRIEAQFVEGGRKVVQADLDKAAAAAGAAFQAVLEGRTSPYEFNRLEVEVDYSYLQSRKRSSLI